MGKDELDMKELGGGGKRQPIKGNRRSFPYRRESAEVLEQLRRSDGCGDLREMM
jgi:hypothetical protein